MDIRQLRYFVMVYEEMSFTKAARRLYVSQPTLSKAIKCMELELDEPLFDRESSELRLTDVGEALLARARVIIKEFDGISAAALNLKSLQSGRVAVALPPIISTLYFTEIISDFKRCYPGITVSVRELEAIKVIPKVQDETFDLGVGIQPIATNDLVVQPLGFEEIVAVMRRDNPLAQK
ncbi:MAG: LysR family transcriptional regulator, partial [Clostridiales bacterium]|nr:LysR family transcriptional regulator [Clostridiales bacterium]